MNREVGVAPRHGNRFPHCRQTQCTFDEQRSAAFELEALQVYVHRDAIAEVNSSRYPKRSTALKSRS